MSLLATAGLTRRPWLADVDLVVERGEIVVLRGPSGSGKTLLLRAVADLDPVDAGEVLLEGVERRAIAPCAWRRRVLYVHPGGERLPGSVADNLSAVARLCGGFADASPWAGDLPDSPGLDPAADAVRLSAGEGQALALRRALLCQPDVLLLDEATAHLDEDSARAWEAALRAWVDGGRGILWVSHDAALAERVGARAVVWP